MKCITTIRETSGIQWGKSQIRVLEGGRVHEKKILLKNDRYDCDKGEERNPMEYVSNNGANKIYCRATVSLSFGL